MSPTFDIYQEITDRIVAAIESAPDFALFWTRTAGSNLKRPTNVASANPYNGVNVLSLWITAQAHGLPPRQGRLLPRIWNTSAAWVLRAASR